MLRNELDSYLQMKESQKEIAVIKTEEAKRIKPVALIADA